MDRLAVHVIATAAVTLTLATVPVLFADACHASSSAVPQSATTWAVTVAPPSPAVAVLPALPDQAQTQAAAAAAAEPARPAPAAAGPAQAPSHRRPGHGRVLLPELPRHACVSALFVGRARAERRAEPCRLFHGYF